MGLASVGLPIRGAWRSPRGGGGDRIQPFVYYWKLKRTGAATTNPVISFCSTASLPRRWQTTSTRLPVRGHRCPSRRRRSKGCANRGSKGPNPDILRILPGRGPSPVRRPRTLTPLFVGDDRLFSQELGACRIYGEYGCGSSTIWVAHHSNDRILAMDSSPAWIT
jgi:hypothetical protein